MRALSNVVPTPEQLRIISRTTTGIEVIRGAAGSGKTTTALFRLRGLAGLYVHRRMATNSQDPVRVLVLTYNRTLKGYIAQLAAEQGGISAQVILEVRTFAGWASAHLGYPPMADETARRNKIQTLGATIPLSPDFLCDEIDYLMGLYPPERRNEYLTARRDGRGASPRIDRALRERILTEVVAPYCEWKIQRNQKDWNDLETEMLAANLGPKYDVVIADETQDFSANQIRAVLHYCREDSAVTFILDSAQRIYARGFSWADVGVRIPASSYHRLEHNYRNTAQIAAFASPLLAGLAYGDLDATVPNLSGCKTNGEIPKIWVGRFSLQMARAISYIRSTVDLETNSVAFLHPWGWFKAVKQGLSSARIPYVEITRQSDWPSGPENIALSTFHSAKGLEFDYVFLLGLNQDVLRHGDDPNDDEWAKLKRMLAMGVTRAKKMVILGYKLEERSDLIDMFEPGTYEEEIL